MVQIGNKPILWHIMRIYASFGLKEFVLALGYKGEVIKQYFLNLYYLQNDFTVTLNTGAVHVAASCALDWTVTLLDTGQQAMTGGRLWRLRSILSDEPFMLTYGDGVANVNLDELMSFHESHGRVATITAVRPPARFGALMADGDEAVEFKEKPQIAEGWINGGFFVFEPAVFDYLEGDATILEKDPLERLAKDRQLMVHKHMGFWQCMDTARDVQLLQQLWDRGQAPWKTWEE